MLKPVFLREVVHIKRQECFAKDARKRKFPLTFWGKYVLVEELDSLFFVSDDGRRYLDVMEPVYFPGGGMVFSPTNFIHHLELGGFV